MKPWSVLILCIGHGREGLRSIVESEISKLGFESHVYDSPNYPVDPKVHSHTACVKAVSLHDIVIAFADESEGGTFQTSSAPAGVVQSLRDLQILPEPGSSTPDPTIFQVEVLLAKTLKPTLVFIPRSVETRVDQTLQLLKAGNLQLQPRHAAAPDLKSLIDKSDWKELSLHFEVPAGRIESFSQLLFLERLRKESPNFVSFYDERNTPDLIDQIKGRLSGVVFALVEEHRNLVVNRIEKKRNPIGESSLNDLLQDKLILAPPFRVISGPAAAGKELFALQSGKGYLAEMLLSRKSTLIIGPPGLGKTTTSLLTFQDVVGRTPEVAGFAPLLASWRDFASPVTSAEDLIRLLLGLVGDHEPWPNAVSLPSCQWLFILDGLDESTWDQTSLEKIVSSLCDKSVVLISCRRHDYERHLQRFKKHFHVIGELLPWNVDQVKKYTEALRASNKAQIADYIDRRLEPNKLPEFLGLPLWLSMLTFLAARYVGEKSSLQLDEITSDYEMLRECFEAVAAEEIVRQLGAVEEVPALKTFWAQSAWNLHRDRRNRQTATFREFASRLGIDETSPLGRAVSSLFDVSGERIIGFSHEVFLEYWTAEYLVNRLVDSNIKHEEIAEQFCFQRSVVTNRFMQERIRAREHPVNIPTRLREAFWTADRLGKYAEFVKDQLVYLLGRIDESDATKSFLRTIWKSSGQSNIVRHSTAFAAIILGDAEIEQEYYQLLRDSEEDDRINRGYHLYYYGDIDISETEMPAVDDGQNPAESTLQQLFERLKRSEQRHRNLRRIELLTIRRFLETGRTVPGTVRDPKAVIELLIEEARQHTLNPEYSKGVQEEVEKILRLLPAE